MTHRAKKEAAAAAAGQVDTYIKTATRGMHRPKKYRTSKRDGINPVCETCQDELHKCAVKGMVTVVGKKMCFQCLHDSLTTEGQDKLKNWLPSYLPLDDFYNTYKKP